ncbi:MULTISPECIES: PilN domain-containing protein [unclassified Halomonas]|uniref:PilN domain-containing protein n=1 Tax=unclassified Halomonas TaxID=2609666 RepID=UPI0006DA7F1A|nr:MULTISPECIES: PilN domain-containing protein [unclassified Halomonas]KPQ22146.1 MAG: type IV pilus assembly protein PilN [Halomonas sp. HL-93]SBR51004.1 type IV pilus assembly protein PilN [Halomonas sp. HL-93]SNY97145.1 type IV pilus assembly protein PilN [Halomonas sp. hl-4]
MSITINLLPWRDQQRERRTRRFYYFLLIMLLVGAALGWGIAKFYAAHVATQQQRNAFIESQARELGEDIGDLSRYKTDALRVGEQLVLFQTLQTQRASTVELFNALAGSVASGVVYQQVSRSGAQVSVEGLAASERQVSDQLRRVADSKALGVPSLSEVESDAEGSGRQFRFDVQQPSLAASAPAEEQP